MHTRRVLQHLRKLLTTETLLYLQCSYLAHCHRRLLLFCQLSGYQHVRQRHRLALHLDSAEVLLGFHLLCCIAHIGKLQDGVFGYIQREITVQIGDNTIGGAFFQHRHTNQRLAIVFVHHGSCYFQRLRPYHCACAQAYKKCK